MMNRISFHGMACRIPYRIDIFFLECDYEMVRSSPYRRYSLLGMAHPLWEIYFRCRIDTGGQRSSEAIIVKKADMWP